MVAGKLSGSHAVSFAIRLFSLNYETSGGLSNVGGFSSHSDLGISFTNELIFEVFAQIFLLLQHYILLISDFTRLYVFVVDDNLFEHRNGFDGSFFVKFFVLLLELLFKLIHFFLAKLRLILVGVLLFMGMDGSFRLLSIRDHSLSTFS
jgi:hypothetical protein